MVRELACGGIERDVTKLALRLDPLRFTPYVATYKPEGPRYDELQKANIPVLHLPVIGFKSPQTMGAAIRLMRFIRQKKIQLLHAFDASAVLGIPLARLTRVPAVLSSTLGDRRLLDLKSERQFRLSDRMVDAIVVNCDAMRSHLINDYSIPPERIELCYNGVDVSEFYPAVAPKPAPVADAPLVIGTVCVLRNEKALDILQEGFAKVRHLTPNAKLLIVGSGPQLPKLHSNAARLGIERESVFMPAVSSVAPLMRAIDIFVSSSRSEAFSNSILEAMACGCCVIGSRVGGTPELINDGERGMLFTPGDPNDLADKLATAITDLTMRKRLGANAAQFAARTLNMDVNAKRNSEIYEKILRRKRVIS